MVRDGSTGGVKLLVLPVNLSIKQITSRELVPVSEIGQRQKKWRGIGGVTCTHTVRTTFVITLLGSTLFS